MMNSQSQSFQDIPPDILLRIFTFLDVEGILSFSSSNRYLRELYQNSVLIAYREALLEAGMIDISDASTSPSFTIREKLTLLKQRQESWRTLRMLTCYNEEVGRDMPSATRVRFMFKPSRMYDLSCGVYVRGGDEGSAGVQSIRILDLYAAQAEGNRAKIAGQLSLDWASIRVGKDESIIDFGLALREHDLVILITEKRTPGGTQVLLHLYQFSTGKQHPLAKVPIILVRCTPHEGNRCRLEVSGPSLVLLLTKPRSAPGNPPDWLALFNWYTGEQITSTTSQNGSWKRFNFLTNQLILLPNCHTATLDIIKFPEPAPTEDIAVPTGNIPRVDLFTKLLSLRLPAHSLNATLSSISCRSEPNPYGHSHPSRHDVDLSLRRGEEACIITASGEKIDYIKGTPFVSAPESSIILVRVVLADHLTGIVESPVFFVHRSSILKILEERGTPGLAMPSPMQVDGPMQVGVVVVPWSTWGPKNTRWVSQEGFNCVRTMATCGQRAILEYDGRLVIWDFNPYSVRRERYRMQQSGVGAFEEEESEDYDIPEVSVVDTPSFYVGRNFNPVPFFCEEVVSELPYVQVVTPESSSYRYGSRVLLDEDHIVDVKRMRRRHGVYIYEL